MTPQIRKHEIVKYLLNARIQITQQSQYKPNLACVLYPNLTEEERLVRLWQHSEKMALAWALLNEVEGTIIMHKNLRVCKDCHTVLKLIAKLLQRTFIVRDANRFHHFQDGKCSCNDYW